MRTLSVVTLAVKLVELVASGVPACDAGAGHPSSSCKTDRLTQENMLLQQQAMVRQDIQPSSFAEVNATGSITIVSYNLYWWNVRQNNRWSQLYNRIRSQGSFDLIGFQECEDVAQVLRSSGLSGFNYYMGPKPNPAPLAWNAQVFTKIGGPGNKWIAKDKWGNRHLNWVRLRHNPTGANVLFANTHGPLGNCGTTVGNNWLGGINENKRGGDVVFMTGDYNCGTGSAAMNILKGQLTISYDAGIDQILSNRGRKQGSGSGRLSGSPSDHPLVKGAFGLSGSSGGGGDGGGGGGGAQFRSGTNNCAAFSQWPKIDGGVTCGTCAALVETGPYGARCDKYCQSFGHTCIDAAEEENDNCQVMEKKRCSEPITGRDGAATTDMLCACQRSSSNYPRRRRSNPRRRRTVSSPCQDYNNQCASWAGAGECNRNPAYMLKNCKRSCRACR